MQVATKNMKSNIEKINSIFSNIDKRTTDSKKVLNPVDEEIKKIMKHNNFTSMDQVVRYINEHYQDLADKDMEDTRKTDINDPNDRRTSPGKLSIDSAGKFIKINEYVSDITKYPYTLTEVIITYVKDFDEDKDYTDTVIFTCSSMEDLWYYWNSFAKQHNLYVDCICSFSVNITEADRRYVESVNKAITEFLPKFIQWESNAGTKPVDKQNTGLIKLVLDTLYSNAGVKIIYPHVSSEIDPDTGFSIYSVKRYWGE